MEKKFHCAVMPQINKGWLALVLSLLTASAVASTLPTFEAEYTAYRYGKKLGYALLSLEASEHKKNSYRLEYYSKVSLFYLSDKRSEISTFEYKDNTFTPQDYRFTRTGTGSNKSTNVLFDQASGKIVVDKEPAFDWLGQFDNQIYRLDMQKKLAQGQTDFTYQVINYRGDAREYNLKVMGKDQLTLPYGTLEGIKVNIVRINSSRETFAWFSPQLNYQLVRLQQFKDDKEQGDIQLKSFELTK
ncbi:MAG: hypothetical protein ACI8R9_002762 [Paraglaciecola sp.]|jgi:hypothetical protein